ncbi:hypothetical protein ACFLZ7_00135 [Nanoarchaeota archaeon]
MGIFSKKKPKKVKKSTPKKIEQLEEGRILCRTIIEMLGKPKEYIVDTLKSYVDKIKQNKDIEIVNEEMSEAVEQEGLFSVFVEIEAWFKNSVTVMDFCFDYMPSSIEIIDPEKLTYTSNQITNLFNDLQARLHTVDMMLKNTVQENKILRKNAGALLRNNILMSLKEKSKKIEEISKKVGIPKEQLKAFLDKTIKEGHIKETKGTYSIVKK